MRRLRTFTIVLLAIAGALLCVAVALTRAAAPAPPPPESARVNAATDEPVATERWRTAMPVNVVGLPEVDSNGIVVTAGEAEVVALTNAGGVSWTTAVAGALVNPPRLDGELVFVAAKRAVVALRRDSGAVVWVAPTAIEGEDDNRVNRPVAVGDVVVATTASGRVFGSDRSTGAQRWVVDLPTAVTSEPAAGGGVVVVVGIGEWRGLDPATGATLWSGELDPFGTSSPVIYDDAGRTVAAVATGGRVVAVDAHTGVLLWRSDADQSELFQVPIISGSHELLVPDHWGRLTAYDPHDGRVAWRVRGADGVAEFGAPVVLDAQTVALSLDDGGPRIGSPRGSTVVRTPSSGHGVASMADGGLVVTTWDGPVNYVLAYDVKASNR